jgi:hypothetical protein
VELHFLFDDAQRQRFRNRELQQVWADRYPGIFDQDDLRLATGPQAPRNHYFEWLAAVRLHEFTGYVSLVEKYDCQNHPRKHALFRKLAGPRVFESVMKNDQGRPDLVVYSPDMADWFFAEVKGAKDRLRDRQRERFAELCELTGKPVMVVNFKDSRQSSDDRA